MTTLLEQKFIPIYRRSGQRDWIAPTQLTEPDIVALAANRADFNGALAQFLIGLVQSTAPIQDEEQWQDFFESPPDAATLFQWFAPIADYFALDGDGVRFMQDRDMDESDGVVCGIDALLIDAPGASSVDKNVDHFVKRNTVRAMCPDCIPVALYTLQLNAPAGGAGHRTSLRGGGPLTTLVVESPTGTLWRDLWMNVQPLSVFVDQSRCGDARHTEAYFKFPWTSAISAIQKSGTETQPAQVHPLHVFWAMPRRIRLNFSKIHSGACDICGRASDRLISEYVTKPHGLNYKGPWEYPYSPYYQNKEDWLPVHPQPGGFGYRHWLSWVFGRDDDKAGVRPAAIVQTHLADRYRKSLHAQKPALWVFGYDMDKAKPRCWYETRFPLYDLTGLDRGTRRQLHHILEQRIQAAEQVVFYVRQSIRHALFGEGEARGDLGYVDQMFWEASSPHFFDQLQALLERAKTTGLDPHDAELSAKLGQDWRGALVKTSLDIFDQLIETVPISQQEPRRVKEAREQLTKSLYGKSINAILRIAPASAEQKAAKAKKGRQAPVQTELNL